VGYEVRKGGYEGNFEKRSAEGNFEKRTSVIEAVPSSD
jgi:hypothetical protein